MRQRTKSAMTVVVAVITAIGMFFAGFFTGRIKDPDTAALDFIYKTYKKYYLEADDDAIEIMARSILDQYSQYYTREQYEELKKISSGVRGGIGISFFDNSEGKVEVYTVLGNSPAEKAGIKAGATVDGVKKSADEDFTPVADRTQLSDFISALDLDEEFSLKVTYKGETADYTLARREYRESYVYYADATGYYRFQGNGDALSIGTYAAEDPITFPSGTAYIKYTAFNGTAKGVAGSAGQIETVMKKFKENGNTRLILDLRGNGGGYMEICEDVSAYFVGADENSYSLIATAEYKKDKNGKGKTETFKSAPIVYGNYNYEQIVVLADENTASASEVLIGAMLSYDERNVVKVVLAASQGRDTDDNVVDVYKSYGKGIMQTTFPNTFGGGAIKLTTAKLYWPNEDKTCIHGLGIAKGTTPYDDKIETPAKVAGEDYVMNRALEICAS